jgi:hypothetical protein
MRNLISHGIIETYAPLNDIPGSYTAQFEHVRKPILYYSRVCEANLGFSTDDSIAQHAQGSHQPWRGLLIYLPYASQLGYQYRTLVI